MQLKQLLCDVLYRQTAQHITTPKTTHSTKG